jgi:hypothetical protein
LLLCKAPTLHIHICTNICIIFIRCELF